MIGNYFLRYKVKDSGYLNTKFAQYYPLAFGALIAWRGRPIRHRPGLAWLGTIPPQKSRVPPPYSPGRGKSRLGRSGHAGLDAGQGRPDLELACSGRICATGRRFRPQLSDPFPLPSNHGDEDVRCWVGFVCRETYPAQKALGCCPGSELFFSRPFAKQKSAFVKKRQGHAFRQLPCSR